MPIVAGRPARRWVEAYALLTRDALLLAEAGGGLGTLDAEWLCAAGQEVADGKLDDALNQALAGEHDVGRRILGLFCERAAEYLGFQPEIWTEFVERAAPSPAEVLTRAIELTIDGDVVPSWRTFRRRCTGVELWEWGPRDGLPLLRGVLATSLNPLHHAGCRDEVATAVATLAALAIPDPFACADGVARALTTPAAVHWCAALPALLGPGQLRGLVERW